MIGFKHTRLTTIKDIRVGHAGGMIKMSANACLDWQTGTNKKLKNTQCLCASVLVSY